jgi:hypothetical protein
MTGLDQGSCSGGGGDMFRVMEEYESIISPKEEDCELQIHRISNFDAEV